ncbi:MAG: hypothetical protein AB1589_02650 [Cyanobacteriota bacterium]
MKIAEALDMKGRLTIQKFNPYGQLIDAIKANNFIVYTGRDLVAQLFLGQPIGRIQYIAVGTGTERVKPIEDKSLRQEVFRKEIKPDPSFSDTEEKEIQTENGVVKQKNRRVIVSADLDYGEPDKEYELTEAGLFNAQTGGIMYNRVVFPRITKTKDFKLTLLWEIIF